MFKDEPQIISRVTTKPINGTNNIVKLGPVYLKKLDLDTQRKYLQILIKRKWDNYQKICKLSPKNKLKHGVYTIRYLKKEVNVYLHYALLVWTIWRGHLQRDQLIIICKQPLSQNGLLARGNASVEIIKVPYLLTYSYKTEYTGFIKPTCKLLLKLQPCKGSNKIYPNKAFLDLVGKLGNLPFHIPVSYQKTNWYCRKGYMMLYRGWSLVDYLKNHSKSFAILDLRVRINFIVLKILPALKKIHNKGKGFVHRDVKLKNLAIAPKNIIIYCRNITNFQVEFIDLEDMKPNKQLDTRTVGSLCYIAPEIMQKMYDEQSIYSWGVPENIITQQSDIYSMGVILVLLLQPDPYQATLDLYAGNEAQKCHGWRGLCGCYHNKIKPEHKKLVKNVKNQTICGIIKKMMTEEPKNRYQSIDRVIKDFKKIL